MSYTLYGSRGSGSAAIEAALEIAGLRYHLVRASSWEADSAQAELARPEFLALLKRIESHPRVAPVFARHWP